MRIIDAEELLDGFCAECARSTCDNCDIEYHITHAKTIDFPTAYGFRQEDIVMAAEIMRSVGITPEGLANMCQDVRLAAEAVIIEMARANEKALKEAFEGLRKEGDDDG